MTPRRDRTRDVPEAQLHLLDAGHFAVEEQPVQIATTIMEFLERLPRSEAPRGR